LNDFASTGRPASAAGCCADRARFPRSEKPHPSTGSVIDTQIQTLPARARAPQAEPAPGAGPSPESLKDAVVRSLDGDKAEDLILIDLAGRSSIADYLVIASGRSARQLAAMADHIAERLQPGLGFPIAVEGLPQGDWVLLDCGDVIVHLFRPEVRAFYALETMWGLQPPLMPSAAGDLAG
jgi:ribosome-associated protein